MHGTVDDLKTLRFLMILMEEGQECKTLSIFLDFPTSSLRMYISEDDVHIFIE